mmetsp:Transcript_7440/g.25309  ORF Transcript_7440/g.25309 Transcript_7440/m.25309 type:complete len:208 (-) Transcript_7440:104-727(-)
MSLRARPVATPCPARCAAGRAQSWSASRGRATWHRPGRASCSARSRLSLKSDGSAARRARSQAAAEGVSAYASASVQSPPQGLMPSGPAQLPPAVKSHPERWCASRKRRSHAGPAAPTASARRSEKCLASTTSSSSTRPHVPRGCPRTRRHARACDSVTALQMVTSRGSPSGEGPAGTASTRRASSFARRRVACMCARRSCRCGRLM